MTPREAVTQALEQGHGAPGLIACSTGLELPIVHTMLRRLRDAGKVTQVSKHCWKLKKDECVLADVWR